MKFVIYERTGAPNLKAAGFTITLKNETYKLLVSPSVFSTLPVFSLATPIMK
jgi:hypothetical protein